MCMKGRSDLDKIQKKKENHVLSVEILKRLLEKAGGHLYDSTGTNPLYQDRTISYKVDEGLSGEKPELHTELEKSSKEGEGNFSGKKPKLHPELKKSSKEGEFSFIARYRKKVRT